MIRRRVQNSIGVLRTTAIGGVFFLLPLVVVGMLLAQVAQVVHSVALVISDYLPTQTAVGYVLLLAIAVVILVLLCFLAGFAARRAIGRRFTQLTEKYLLMLFPRYSIFKEQLSGNIGGNEFHNTLKPVSLKYLDMHRIAMEIERDEQGQVAVFLPGSPDPWTGSIVIVPADRVQPLSIEFADAMATFEQLGRKTLAAYATKVDTVD